jgi:sec-independent protein translocase protein TatB
MRGAVEDIKTEIMKETDNPVSEIKREIEKVKDAAKDFNPMNDIQKDILQSPQTAQASNEPPKPNLPKTKPTKDL